MFYGFGLLLILILTCLLISILWVCSFGVLARRGYLYSSTIVGFGVNGGFCQCVMGFVYC